MINHGFGVMLGPVERGFQPFLRNWRNDPRIFKWCRQNDLLSESDQDGWFARQSKDPSIRMYQIHLSPEKVVGVCGLTSLDLLYRRAEFSLYVAPEEQKKGYARAALQTLFTHGFRAYGLNSIWGESFAGNPAMVLFRKLGMTYEGVRREFYYRDGKFIDAHLFSILRSDWDHLLPVWISSGGAQKKTRTAIES